MARGHGRSHQSPRGAPKPSCGGGLTGAGLVDGDLRKRVLRQRKIHEDGVAGLQRNDLGSGGQHLAQVHPANTKASSKRCPQRHFVNQCALSIDARFDLALCEMSRHGYEQAMEQLFYIQEHGPDFKEGAAREMIITIVNMLAPENPEFAQQYRRKLSSMLSH